MEGNKENINPSKKIRNPKSHKRVLNKLRRKKGLDYQTQKGKQIPRKSFKKIVCKCRLSCHLTVDEQKQKQIFQHYYNLSSWSEKSNFLLLHTEISDIKKRRKADKRKNIQFNKIFKRRYFLTSKEEVVCKRFFKKVLQISEGRIERLMKKRQNLSSCCVIDYRGRHSSHKKTSSEAIQNVIEFINLFPQYESHYTRNTNNRKKYLASNLNFRIMYDEFKQWSADRNSIPVSMYMFRDVFYRRFNLRFKQPAQDTCDFCNKLDNMIKNAPIKSIEKISYMEQKAEHLQCVEFISQEY